MCLEVQNVFNKSSDYIFTQNLIVETLFIFPLHTRYTHLPPEILLQHVSEFSKETDIWAYGLTIWEMYTAQKPFRNFAQDQVCIVTLNQINVNMTHIVFFRRIV